MDLENDVADAHRYIEETIKGRSTSDTREGMKYRTPVDMLIGIVQQTTGGNGDVKTKSNYKTEPVSVLAIRKATNLLKVLKLHTIKR